MCGGGTFAEVRLHAANQGLLWAWDDEIDLERIVSAQHIKWKELVRTHVI
jgi:hypothetical protein